ncbi:MAG: M20/M25/M40 family metallo-hydrolase [Planctomycetota bacterium]|jgi:endoglucanase
MRKESRTFLEKLLDSPTPSGHEAPGQKLWCDYARTIADQVRTDSYGNAVAALNPKGSPRIMLDGHVDEIGLMIKHIDDSGQIAFQAVGGINPSLLRSKRVSIHTSKGIVRGVIGAVAPHLTRGKEEKPPAIHDLTIDIGAKDGKAARKRVSVGDVITFVDSFEMLTDDLAVARAFDNRVGTWAAIEALRLAKADKRKLDACLIACSSVQEEVGLKGATMNVHNVKPDAALIVEVTHATDTPGISAAQHGQVKLGEGPSISIGRENHPAVIDKLRAAAKAKKIKLQIEAFNTSGGTDAMAIYAAIGGVPSAVVGIPTRYMHSTVEMISFKDLQQTADLLAETCLNMKKGDQFKMKI